MSQTISDASFLTDIRSALEARLLGLSGLPTRLIGDNDPGELQPGERFLSFGLIRTSTETITTGPSGIEEHRGLFSVAVGVSKGEGPRDAEALADRIRGQFRPGLILPFGVANVRVRTSHARTLPESAGDAWFRATVTVGWWCHEMR